MKNEQPGGNRAIHQSKASTRRLTEPDSDINPLNYQPKLETKKDVLERADFRLKQARGLFFLAASMED